MRKSSTKKGREPSKASLEEIPEVDLARYHIVGRGRHVELARRSLEFIALDKKVVEALGGPERVRLLVNAAAKGRPQSRKKRSAA